MSNFRIGENKIGINEPLYFIADIAANHDGDINRAYNLIELAKEAGAHAAKFQNFIANKIVSNNGFINLGDQVSHQKNWKKSVYDTYEEASISYEWTQKLKQKCDECEIEYFTSPYDFESVDYVDPYVNVYKIGSGDVTWHDIINYIASKGKPVIIATGASDMSEVKMAMEIIQSHTNKVVLMQCNTNYTADSNNYRFINLNVLKAYSEIFPDAVLGLSDHTFGSATVLGAIALGARVFEKHFTDDNNRDGPDHKFSMNPKTWNEMVISANELYSSLGDGNKKIENNELKTSIVQRRALYTTKNLPKGHIIKQSDLFPLRPRPINSIPPYELKTIIGKRIKRDIIFDNYITKEDFE